jgi:hypothetical protein
MNGDVDASSDAGDPLREPVDIGDRFRWSDGGATVEILNMYIAEDGEVQVRVKDGEERRTVTADDVVQRIASGDLVAVEPGDP